MGKETAAVKNKPICNDADCKECTKRRNLVDESHIGRIVSYYDEGWRVGTLEAVRMYGAFQRDDEGHIISTGISTIRPLGGKYAKGVKDPVKIAIEDVRLEAAVIVPTGTRALAVAEAIALSQGDPVLHVLDLHVGPTLPPPPAIADFAAPAIIPPVVAAFVAEHTGRSGIVMDLPKARAMQAAGASWTDIAVAMGYPRGKGQNRCKRALEGGTQ